MAGYSFYLPFVAELLGTCAFLTVILHFPNPLVIGLGLAAVIFATQSLSGGHINPAVTTTMYLNGSITASKAALYVVSQVLGGALALFIHQGAVSYI